MLCSCPYTGTTSLVPYRKLPTTVITNAESSPASPYSNLAYELDLSRTLASRRILLSRRGHTRPSASDYEMRSRESLSLKNSYMYVNIASKKKTLPLAASRCSTGKWPSVVPLTCVELRCSLATVNVNNCLTLVSLTRQVAEGERGYRHTSTHKTQALSGVR